VLATVLHHVDNVVDNVVDLKHRIVAEWGALDHSIIVSAIVQWRLPLHACVRAAGGHWTF